MLVSFSLKKTANETDEEFLCENQAVCDLFFFFVFVYKGVSCQPGEIVFGCVLDCDLDRKLVYVSLIPDIVKQSKAAAESQKSTQKKVTKFRKLFIAFLKFSESLRFGSCSVVVIRLTSNISGWSLFPREILLQSI